MENNVFIQNVAGIVKTSYAGEEKPQHDWQTSIDMFNATEHITEGMATEEIERQRSEFIAYVAVRKFNKDGEEV